MNQFSKGLDKNKANYIPLSPLSFITRAKDIYPNYESVVCLLYTSDAADE